MPKLLKAKDAAKLLGKSQQTLAIWRCTKRYRLPYTRIGGSIFYDEKDLRDFMKAGRVDVQTVIQ